MRADFLPLRVLLLSFSGWVHRQQLDVIEYLVEENRVLREQIGSRRLRLTDCHRLSPTVSDGGSRREAGGSVGDSSHRSRRS